MEAENLKEKMTKVLLSRICFHTFWIRFDWFLTTFDKWTSMWIITWFDEMVTGFNCWFCRSFKLFRFDRRCTWNFTRGYLWKCSQTFIHRCFWLKFENLFTFDCRRRLGFSFREDYFRFLKHFPRCREMLTIKHCRLGSRLPGGLIFFIFLIPRGLFWRHN